MRPAGGTPADLHVIRKLAEGHYQSYLGDLRALVNIDCGTFIPAGVNRVADFMQDRFGSSGWSVERIPRAAGPGAAADLGDIVVATLAGTRAPGGGGTRIL